jgi:flagellar biosynthesis protein FlhB
MAENENQQERTQQPTAKRLEQARQHGQVPRSPDLTAAAVLLVCGGAMLLLGRFAGTQLRTLMGASLSLPRARLLDESVALPSFGAAALHVLPACAGLWAASLLAAITAPLLLGGRSFSLEVLSPDLSRLSPAAGFARMFSLRGVVELTKAFAKFLLLGLTAVALLWKERAAIMGLGFEPLPAAIAHATALTGFAVMVLAATLALIAAVDVPWQLWQHTQRLRMSRAELREEMRESEGAPEVRNRIRSLQREFAKRRMMQQVPKADVVVVNPTHYAVALRYDEQRMRAPVVVAKGQDLIAARIREIAVEHQVPVFEAPPLARALHRHVEIGAEIPAALYVAVAQVLTYLAQLRNAHRHGAQPPPLPVIDVNVDPAPRLQ